VLTSIQMLGRRQSPWRGAHISNLRHSQEFTSHACSHRVVVHDREIVRAAQRGSWDPVERLCGTSIIGVSWPSSGGIRWLARIQGNTMDERNRGRAKRGSLRPSFGWQASSHGRVQTRVGRLRADATLLSPAAKP